MPARIPYLKQSRARASCALGNGRLLCNEFLHHTSARIANQTTGYSSMRAAWPAARPSHPFFKLRAHPFDMLPPRLIFLDGDGPADPLVARERRYVFPGLPCLRIGHERIPEIGGKIMYDSFGDSDGCHRVIRRLKDQASDVIPEYNSDLRDHRPPRDFTLFSST